MKATILFSTALLVVGFVPTLVMGRVAMSDVPSLALVVLGLWLFWRGIERGGRWIRSWENWPS